VSVLGNSYLVYIGTNLTSEDGTSASSPTFAAMVSLINVARIRAGKGSVGFMNPALYSAPASVFNDVTVGSNNNYLNYTRWGASYDIVHKFASVLCGPDVGYVAAPGWDPASGFGSPKFEQMKQYMVSLGGTKGGLSPGAIAGIVIAAVVVFVGIAGGISWYLWGRSAQRAAGQSMPAARYKITRVAAAADDAVSTNDKP